MKRSTTPMQEGAGAQVRRLMPVHGFLHFDPFVLWDHFTLQPGTGFPDHPHRGFEAITYLFAGAMSHKDNLGNESTVRVGGAQRFTAGHGLVHSEMPAPEGETAGIQLWINLPKALKQIDPSYEQVDGDKLPVIAFPGGSVREIAGPHSPLSLHTDVLYQDVTFTSAGEYVPQVPSGYAGFVYVAEGNVEVNRETAAAGEAVVIGANTGLALQAKTPARAMVCMGRPHGEPIRQRGPFVE